MEVIEMGYYHVAQICINGHCTCSSVDENPEMSQNFCKNCGKITITACPSCRAKIRGSYKEPGIIDLCSTYHTPAYCYNCGAPYPWTQTALDSTKELIAEDENLHEDEKKKLSESLPDIMSVTPRTQLATTRIKKSLQVAGKYTADAIRQFVIDFGCELALKSMGFK